MKKKTAGLCLLCALLFVCAGTSAQDSAQIEAALNQEWAGKTALLRHPCAGNTIVIEKGEATVGACGDYAWAADSIVEIKQVRLVRDGIQVDAKRVAVGLDSKQGKFGLFRDGAQLRIDFKTAPKPPDIPECDRHLNSFFDTSPIQIADLAPAHWQFCLRGELVRQPKSKRWWCHYSGANDDWINPQHSTRRNPTQWLVFKRMDEPNRSERYSLQRETVYRVSEEKGVTPPKAIYTPDPSYPPVAKASGLQKMTVLYALIDEQGRVADVQVASPAGSYFDDASVRSVSNWKFQPAMFQGKPVPVVVMVEVNFRLY